MLFWKASVLLSAATVAAAKLTWADTKFMFVFGDSYTTTGFNVSAGVNSPDPGFVGAGCARPPKRGSHASILPTDFVQRTQLGGIPSFVPFFAFWLSSCPDRSLRRGYV